MQSSIVVDRPQLVALCAVVWICSLFGGCAPERMTITDADDLAQFAAASKLSAEKRVAAVSTVKHDATKTMSGESRPTGAAPVVAKKPELDAESQALLKQISKQRNYDAAQIAEFESALATLSPEIRTTWVASEVAKLNQSKPVALVAPPRALPEVVKAEPIRPKESEILQADYRQPTKELPPAATNQGDVSEEMRDVKEKLAKMIELEQKRQADQRMRDDLEEEAARRKEMMDLMKGSDGGMRGLMGDDDENGSSLPGLSTKLIQAQVAAAMAKSSPKKSGKSAPLLSDTPNAAKPDSPGGAMTPSTLTNQHLEQLWSQISGGAANDPSLSLAMRKKIFLLVAGDVNAASAPPENFTEAEKEYWKHLIRVLDLSVKLGDHPRRDRQAALVGRELREAGAELESASVLDLQNATFCSSVQSFGNYVEFEDTTFKPNEEVVLYVEVQNFASKQRDDGKAFETDLHGSYQILDSSGKRVADLDLPTEHGVCRQRRRDYFLAYRMHLPKNIDSGDYTLQLTMEDKNSGKFGQTTLKFAIGK